MGMFSRKPKLESFGISAGEDQHCAQIGEPVSYDGIPIGVYAGRTPNPHILYGQDDLETGPVTFARYNMSRGIHDVQLSNGWQRTAYGRICNYLNEGYMAEVVPQIPGQMRQYGAYGPPAGFVPRGGSPAQWQAQVNAVSQQPTAPGGPGQYLGTIVHTGAGG
jgi:hypothetical protein